MPASSPSESGSGSSSPLWRYVDDGGRVQGPFSTGQMDSWYAHGYFQPSTPCQREGQEGSGFQPMSDFFPYALKGPHRSIPPSAGDAQPSAEEDSKAEGGGGGGGIGGGGGAVEPQREEAQEEEKYPQSPSPSTHEGERGSPSVPKLEPVAEERGSGAVEGTEAEVEAEAEAKADADLPPSTSMATDEAVQTAPATASGATSEPPPPSASPSAAASSAPPSSSSPSLSSHSTPSSSPAQQEWYYVDDSGGMRGPFPTSMMTAWCTPTQPAHAPSALTIITTALLPLHLAHSAHTLSPLIRSLTCPWQASGRLLQGEDGHQKGR